MNLDFGKLIKSVSKVKLGGGIFGKTCTVIMVIAVTFGFISWVSGNIWVCVASIGLTFIMAFVLLWRLINFANKNPQAVILEGAEFLVHQQIELASKGIPSIPIQNITTETPFIITEATKALADKPDLPEKRIEGKEENNG